MVRMEWETEITGTPACLATRSAVRWRVPVSTVAMAGSGIRWTLAQRMRLAVSSRTRAPSILASSERRWAVKGTSIWNPPVNSASTWGGEPSTIRAPVLARRIRSSPGRRGVPGATWRSTSSRRSSRLNSLHHPDLGRGRGRGRGQDRLGLGDRVDRVELDAGAGLDPLGEAGGRDQSAAEAEPLRLGQAAGQLGDGADLTAQADLADGDQVGRHL